MFVASLVRAKGTFVATIEPERTVADLLVSLGRHNVGALVVSTDGQHIDGVVSERDVACHLGRDGALVLEQPVSVIMTRDVRTCSPHDRLEDLMLTMTRERIRHVPVVEGGTLVGIVSIGDVVKSRLDELQAERDELAHYISH